MFELTSVGRVSKKMAMLVSSLKVAIQITLFVIFLAFFGFPTINKYYKKETIILTSKEFTNGIEPPALTIAGFDGKMIGWKTPQVDLDTWTTFSLYDHCEELNKSNIQTCIQTDSYSFSEVIKGAHYGPSSNYSKLSWTEDMQAPFMGRLYTLKSPKKVLKPSLAEDMLKIILQKHSNYAIFVHDEDFFLANTNPLGPPNNGMIMTEPIKNFYID